MAKSPSHILGELIGNFFENAMKDPIKQFSKDNDLYFDTIGPRPARKGKKITWDDIDGNSHDLDYVLERGGTEQVIGTPVAFIELAWRRYTKHSKNKVQEISGAINPIVQKYKKTQPFKGAILSGEFTRTSLNQLRSENFAVLYIPFSDLVSVFRENQLDIFFDEDTSEEDLSRIVSNWNSTDIKVLDKIKDDLLNKCSQSINLFIKQLSESVNRTIESINVLPLHGKEVQFPTIESAINYIGEYEHIPPDTELKYIEIIVRYSNGSYLDCHFTNKQQAIKFLNSIN